MTYEEFNRLTEERQSQSQIPVTKRALLKTKPVTMAVIDDKVLYLQQTERNGNMRITVVQKSAEELEDSIRPGLLPGKNNGVYTARMMNGTMKVVK